MITFNYDNLGLYINDNNNNIIIIKVQSLYQGASSSGQTEADRKPVTPASSSG